MSAAPVDVARIVASASILRSSVQDYAVIRLCGLARDQVVGDILPDPFGFPGAGRTVASASRKFQDDAISLRDQLPALAPQGLSRSQADPSRASRPSRRGVPRAPAKSCRTLQRLKEACPSRRRSREPDRDRRESARHPPELSRISLRQTINGKEASTASTGGVCTPLGNAVVVNPSMVGRPPVPPVLNRMTSKSGPRSGFSAATAGSTAVGPPRNIGFHIEPAPSAGTRSGTTWAKTAEDHIRKHLADDVPSGNGHRALGVQDAAFGRGDVDDADRSGIAGNVRTDDAINAEIRCRRCRNSRRR